MFVIALLPGVKAPEADEYLLRGGLPRIGAPGVIHVNLNQEQPPARVAPVWNHGMNFPALPAAALGGVERPFLRRGDSGNPGHEMQGAISYLMH